MQMLRTLIRTYVKCSAKAVEFYQEAFSLTPMAGAHVEPDIDEQIQAISEIKSNVAMENNLQLCLQFNEDELYKVKQTYDNLQKDDQTICNLVNHRGARISFID